MVPGWYMIGGGTLYTDGIWCLGGIWLIIEHLQMGYGSWLYMSDGGKWLMGEMWFLGGIRLLMEVHG